MKRWIVSMLVVLVGCGSAERDPWGKRLTEDERAAWGRTCGPIYERDPHDVSLSYETRSAPDAKISVSCMLDWDPKRNRLRQASVDLGVGGLQATAPTDEQIAPHFALMEPLLPANEQRIAREIAFGPERTVQTKRFVISGGRGAVLAHTWSLHVKLR